MKLSLRALIHRRSSAGVSLAASSLWKIEQTMTVNRKASSAGAVLGVAIAVALGINASRLDAQVGTPAAPTTPVAMPAEAPIAAISNGGLALPDFRTIVRSNIDAIVKIEVVDRGQTPEESGAEDEGDGLESNPFRRGNPFGNGRDPFEQFFRGLPQQQQPRSGIGSGFIVGADGKILTNAHVVKGAEDILVRLNDQRSFKATVVGLDESTDIAVLKVDAKGLPTVKLGDSDRVEVGEWVLAIGSPFQLDFSATQGIVSATGRNLDRFVPFIQTDAAVNPGNSGGPLFNIRGEVIGINSQIFSRSGGYMGLSFAIPIKTAMSVQNQLETKGFVDRGWLGVGIQALTPAQAKALDLDRPIGAAITQVEPGSPADKAGLQPYDVILKFNGKTIRDSTDLPPIVSQTPVDSSVPVELLRDGERLTLDVKVGKLAENRPVAASGGNDAPESRKLANLAVSGLTDAQKEKLGIEHGVVITDLRPGPAAEAGLQRGDVVLEVNRRPVDSAEEFASRLEGQAKDKPTLLLIRRGEQSLFLVVEDLA